MNWAPACAGRRPVDQQIWARESAATARRQAIFGDLERIDRWFWRQQMRDREAYLAGAQDIFELEERLRRLERSVGSRYY